MAKSSNYWDKRALKRLSDSEKMSDEYIKRVKKIYDKAFKDIEKDIENVYKNYSKDTGLDVQKLKELLSRSETEKTWKQLKRQGLDKYVKNNYKARISRLEKVQAQIYAKAKLIYPKEELEQTMCYKGVVNDSYYKAVYDTQMGTGLNFGFSKIDTNLMTALLSERWSGKNYSERIWGNTDILAQSLSDVIGAGMIQGQSVAKMTKQVRDRFNVSKYYAERLVRTETNHFNNMADAMAYEEMDVDYYVFVATLDNRTSEICQNMDGKKFKYSEKEEGVNYPPLHPNCRSKTRGYIDEETEKTLQRRARNPKTGKTELIDNISYKEWAKKNGLVDKPVKKKKAPVKTSKKATVDINNLPSEFLTKSEAKNTKLWVDAINKSKGADPKVVKVYNLMGKAKKGNFKISHAKGYSLSYNNSGTDIKLKIPKMNGADDIRGLTGILHENMHWIDYMAGNKKFISLQGNLYDVVAKTNADFSDDIAKIFRDFNKGFYDIQDKVNDKYSIKFKELRDKWTIDNNSEFKKQWKALVNAKDLEIDTLRRSQMGGGVGNLQDIYDALSKGDYREHGILKYGHGKKYYASNNARVKEIVANYSTLSICRPDLIKLLKADKPELVSELDKLMDIIINELGG